MRKKNKFFLIIFLKRRRKVIIAAARANNHYLRTPNRIHTNGNGHTHTHTHTVRFGVVVTEEELQVLWDGALKNKYGTVDFHEFTRHFGSRPPSSASNGRYVGL